jgi:hypothetical protein
VRVGRTLSTISVRAISHGDEEEGMMVAVKQEFETMNPKRDDKTGENATTDNSLISSHVTHTHAFLFFF